MPAPEHGKICDFYEEFTKNLEKEIEKEKACVSFSASFESWKDSPVVHEMMSYMSSEACATIPHAEALLLDAYLLAKIKQTV